MIRPTCLLNCNFSLIALCSIVVVTSFFACRSVPVSAPAPVIVEDPLFRCETDPALVYGSLADFCSCLGIALEDHKQYTMFQIEEKLTAGSSDIPRERLSDELKQKIVLSIKKDLYKTFSEFDSNYWESEKVLVPVKSAFFIMKSNPSVVRAVSLVKSKDIEAMNVLKYLPYEYKEFYLEKMKIRLERNFE